MKRITGTMVSLLIILSLAACGGGSKSWEAQYDLGLRQALEGNYEEAVLAFTAAIEIEPRSAALYVSRGDAYYDWAQFGAEDAETKLENAAADYQQAIDLDGSDADVYLKLTDVYEELDDEDAALEVLRRGLERLPDDAELAERYYAAVIPKYKIRQTLYQELRADDGVLLARNEYNQPVFTGDGDRVDRMNAVFENEIADASLDDFADVPELYNNRQGFIYEEVQSGTVGGYVKTWEESYRKNQYISFAASGEWYGFGVHGGTDVSGCTFDASTGRSMTVSDILDILSEDLRETLYNEYIAYHAALGDGFDVLARDSAEAVENQCGDDAVFWLAADGMHIYFDEYTFYYAAGSSELVIPYDRTDLFNEPFAAAGSDTPGDAAEADWKQAYLSTLQEAQAYAENAENVNHDYYGDYPRYISGFQLADLNFDGMPELLLFGDGASVSEMMRIFTVTDAGAIKVFQDWVNMSSVILYRNINDGSLAYIFIDGNGEYGYYEGKAYKTDSYTQIDSGFEDSAKIADFSKEYKTSGEEAPVFTFNGRDVSEEKYNRLKDELLADYEEVFYTPAALRWDYSSPPAASEYSAVLDSYRPES